MVSGGHQALFNGIAAVKDDYDVTLTFEGKNNPEMRKNIDEFQELMPNVKLCPLLQEVECTHIPSKKEQVYIKIRNCYYSLLNCFKEIMDAKVPIDDGNKGKESNLTSYWESTVVPRANVWIEHLYKITRERKYDIIQIEMPWHINDILAMPEGTKVIHVHHELGFVRRELEINNYVGNHFYEVCKKFADFNEIGLLNMYDAVVTLSSVDAKKLENNGVKIPVYSSFATITSSTNINKCQGSGKRLTFIGFGNHGPNFEGIKWFLENCWDKLNRLDSGYTLDIIGKWDDDIIAQYTTKYPGVTFLGFVDDLYAAIKDSVMIVPITIGSGIRMKILEAASKGVPFVSTIVGAEGIPVTNGKDCFLTDNPDIFVEDIIKLQDSNLRNSFVHAAHQMVQKEYSIEALRKNRLEIYEKVLAL